MAGARLITPHRDWVSPDLLDRWIYRHGRLFSRPKQLELDLVGDP